MIKQYSSIGSRIIAPLLVAMALVVSFIPLNAYAADQRNECGDCTWEITSSGVLRIYAEKDTGNTLASFGPGSAYAPWTAQGSAEKITSVKVDSDIKANTSLYGMFQFCKNMTRANLTQMDTSNATNMSNMFDGCGALKEINWTYINTKNVTDMSGMFNRCESIESIDLSNFDTKNVKNMSQMFAGCKSLTELDLNTFDTEHATNLSGMFNDCTSLKTVQVGSSFYFQGEDGNDAVLPGKYWLSTNEGIIYTAADITANRNGVTDTYEKVEMPDSSDGSDDSILIYRLYNPNSGEHLFTTDANEYKVLGGIGWKQEGYAWKAPKTGKVVYRLYNPNSGDHHFTTDTNEYKVLGGIGWNQEGAAWCSSESNTQPIYRLFNPNETIGTHHYTTDENEYKTLGGIGWKQESVGWYGLPL